MDIGTLNDIANSQFAYLTMFMLLLLHVLKTTNEREEKMREQMDKIVPILDHLVRDVDDIKKEIKRREG